ncbi:MAG: SPFH domain-containing protein [Myxococcota bacterium]
MQGSRRAQPPEFPNLKLPFSLGALSTLLGLGAFAVHTLGGTNPLTPPGHEGYVYHQPLVFGQREFMSVQSGASSTGWRWRQFVTNIDVRIATYSEEMHIFASDNLEVSFEAHARIRLRPGSIREVVERYSGREWYATNVMRPYRTAVREVVRQYTTFAIKDESVAIAQGILDRLRTEYKDTPFEFLSVSIGNIAYPEAVKQRVVANLAAEQRRQRMEVQRRIAEERAQIREIRARGESRAQQIEQETLTPLFVQHEAAELYQALADETDDDDGVAKADVILVVPTRTGQAGIPRIFSGGNR